MSKNCKYCGGVFYPSRLERHIKMCKGLKGWHCAICESNFSDARSLKIHKSSCQKKATDQQHSEEFEERLLDHMVEKWAERVTSVTKSGVSPAAAVASRAATQHPTIVVENMNVNVHVHVHGSETLDHIKPLQVFKILTGRATEDLEADARKAVSDMARLIYKHPENPSNNTIMIKDGQVVVHDAGGWKEGSKETLPAVVTRTVDAIFRNQLIEGEADCPPDFRGHKPRLTGILDAVDYVDKNFEQVQMMTREGGELYSALED
jgi:hypothetical protein